MKSVRQWLFLIVAAPLLFLTAGCSSSPYVEGYFYTPRPVVANIPSTQPTQPSPVSASASIIGIRVDDKKANLPESVEVRLEVDNNGPAVVSFDAHSMELITGDLYHFPPPIIQSSGPVTLNAGESAFATAFFPFTDGKTYENLDLSTLQLRWVIYIADERIQQVASFRRARPRYVYYGYYDPYWGWWGGPYVYGPYIGGVVVFRRH